MAQANQVQLMNNLKRKLSSNVPENDFQNKKALTNSADISSASSSSAFALIDQFLMEEQSKGALNIINNQHLEHKWWRREPLLLQFLEVVAKLIEHKDDPNPIDYVLLDIEVLCIEILGLQGTDSQNIQNTIVTSALQVSKNHELHADKGGVVKVEPKPKKGIISAIIDFAVQIAAKILVYPDSPSPPSNPMLEGNFAPIRQETCPTSDLKVRGQIPANLNGMMVRNGPNPAFDQVAMYSWMDGDSMFHGIRFKNGKATFVSRYIQTSRLKQENFFGQAQFLQYGDLEGKFGLLMSCVQLLRAELEVLDVSYGWLNANTGLIYHDGKLMALQDFDKPYVVNISRNGDLDTLGINDYNKRLGHSFLPHPKKDPTTGEMFIVGVSYTPPYAIYNHVTKEGVMSDPVRLNTVSGPSYMHDLGITKNYVIFMDLPYCYDPEYMAKHDDWVYMFNTEKKPRFGVLPRYAKSEEKIKWFEFNNSFFIFHNGNSWEEDDETIVLISCAMKPDEPPAAAGYQKKTKLFFNPAHVSNGRKRRNITPARVYNGMQTLLYSQNNNIISGTQNNDADDDEDVPLTLPTLYKFTFNMKTGDACLKELFTTKCDYPKINESYMGRKSQYLYTSEFNKDSKITALVKTDLKWNNELKLELGDNKFGSEVAFVPLQHTGPLALLLAEDDGFLTTFVHDEDSCVSFTYVIDAKKMELTAMVELPTRVPYGFHATFVTEDEIQAQKLIT